MEGVADLMAALKSHPVAIAAGILVLAVAARIVGRVALYAVMIVLIVTVGAVWTGAFLEWMN
jgi:hypothetical protein